MSNMISVASGFQYSVNIGYDLNSNEKLENFIPTQSSLDLLEEILLSTDPASTERARILIGAYGKGKSHIVLTILAMLMKKDLTLFKQLLPKLEERPQLKQVVLNYYDSKNKILPVVITGSNTTLTQAFLLALQNTLAENDFLDIMPKTNYQAAVNVIEKWKQEFPDTYRNFEEKINEPIHTYIGKLQDFNIQAYEKFEKLYPSLTAGSIFNPFLGFDVVELYEEVAKELKKKGFTGIYVIYDEFSKYLEANILEASVSDTKTLQDFAEKCNRSAKLQLHLMLISHKEISNYIDELPKSKTDGWRGVSERFKHVHLNNNFKQTYEIIASVIQKNDEWSKFVDDRKTTFEDVINKYKIHQLFSDVDNFDKFVLSTYPLHPISTYILPRLSERVAQNERTLFTFLSSDSVATLPAFLKEYNDNEFKLITPDLIYDYFEPLFKKEVYQGTMHKMYVLTTRILDNLEEGSLASKIVKTLALIYILEQTETLKPTEEEVIGIFEADYPKDEIVSTIDYLIEQAYVIYLKRSNRFLKLKETSGVDISKTISDIVEKQRKNVVLRDVLNERNLDKAVYPARYNDENEMTRYFSFEFINESEVSEDTNWDIKAEQYKADGVIFGVLPDSSSSIEELREKVLASSKGYDRYVFVVPNSFTDIENTVRELNAVITLKDKSIEDKVLFDEYDVVYDDLNEVVTSYINGYTHPEQFMSVYVCNGETKKVRRKASLTALLSNICDVVYPNAPIIVNESINKSVLTSVASKSRDKIISALLRNSLETNLGFTGHGQEVTIMRSTLVTTNLLINEAESAKINLNANNDTKIQYVIEEIVNFIASAKDEEQSFEILYDRLMKPEYGIGIRKGLIPIFIATVFHVYAKEIILANDRGQMSLSLDTLLQIDAQPKNATLACLDWDKDKAVYLDSLEKLYLDYTIAAEKERDEYAYIVNAMSKWYMGLPKYAKEMKKKANGKKIERSTINFLKLLKQHNGNQKLLFEDLPKNYKFKEFNGELVASIKKSKEFYDNAIDNLINEITSFMNENFVLESNKHVIEEMSLSSVIADWLESLNQSIYTQAFANGTDKFLNKVKQVTNDDNRYVKNIAKFATDLRLDDWNDSTIEKFKERILKFKNTAESYEETAETVEEAVTNNYQLSFVDNNGDVVTKKFDKVEETGRGKLLKNALNAQINSMGQAVSEQEKRQIVMEILKNMF